jgi:hypothetical protein
MRCLCVWYIVHMQHAHVYKYESMLPVGSRPFQQACAVCACSLAAQVLVPCICTEIRSWIKTCMHVNMRMYILVVWLHILVVWLHILAVWLDCEAPCLFVCVHSGRTAHACLYVSIFGVYIFAVVKYIHRYIHTYIHTYIYVHK